MLYAELDIESAHSGVKSSDNLLQVIEKLAVYIVHCKTRKSLLELGSRPPTLWSFCVIEEPCTYAAREVEKGAGTEFSEGLVGI